MLQEGGKWFTHDDDREMYVRVMGARDGGGVRIDF